MTDAKTGERERGIALDYELDAPPQKVWRALSIPEFRDRWLPREALAEPEATSVTPGAEVRYRMRETTPPFLESTVTFRIVPNGSGGTNLRILHEPTDLRLDRATRAVANNNTPIVMLAA